MKKKLKKLALDRETLRSLDDRQFDEQQLEKAAGGITGTCYRLSECTCTNTRYCG